MRAPSSVQIAAWNTGHDEAVEATQRLWAPNGIPAHITSDDLKSADIDWAVNVEAFAAATADVSDSARASTLDDSERATTSTATPCPHPPVHDSAGGAASEHIQPDLTTAPSAPPRDSSFDGAAPSLVHEAGALSAAHLTRGCSTIREIEESDQADVILTPRVTAFVHGVNAYLASHDVKRVVAWVETCGRCSRTSLARALYEMYDHSSPVNITTVDNRTFQLEFTPELPPGTSGRTRGSGSALPWQTRVFVSAARTLGEIAADHVSRNRDMYKDVVFLTDHGNDIEKLIDDLTEETLWWGDAELLIVLNALNCCNLRITSSNAALTSFHEIVIGDVSQYTLDIAYFNGHYYPTIPAAPQPPASSAPTADSSGAAALAAPGGVSGTSADHDAAVSASADSALAAALEPILRRLQASVDGDDGDDDEQVDVHTSTEGSTDDEGSSFMEIPDRPGVKYSIQTIARRLWDYVKGMSALDRVRSLPRLQRIAQAYRLSSIDTTLGAVSAGDVLTPGCNVALAFRVGTAHKLYFGQVVKIFRRGSESGKRTNVMRGVALEDVDAGAVEVVCEYFSPVAGKRHKYCLGAQQGAERDFQAYDLQAVLGLAMFEYDEGTDTFTLLPNQLNKFEDLAKKAVGSVVSSEKGAPGARKRSTPSDGVESSRRSHTTTAADRAKKRTPEEE